jgi:RNA polymerase subunit RPABC4/transcription elongation factor Spt4
MACCEKCMILTDDASCPSCGSEKIRDPKENDPVYLVESEAI